LFTKLLAQKLLAARTASYTPRVVFLSSGAHAFGPGVTFDTIEHPSPEKYDTSIAYFEAKAASILTAIELSKRSKGAINAYSLHPGSKFKSISRRF
jgi:nucleoside-diphosphate-sugar epimerase